MTLSPSLGLHQVFFGWDKYLQSKRGLISGKPVLLVGIRQFCNKGSRYCIQVAPAGLPLLGMELFGKETQGTDELAGGRWIGMEGPVLSFQSKL